MPEPTMRELQQALYDNWACNSKRQRKEFRVYQAVVAALEDRERLRKALEKCLYFLPSFNDPAGGVELDGKMVDVRHYVTGLLGKEE